jgi:hypothetical protein
MNKRMDFSHLGGLLAYQDTLAFLQSSSAGPLDALAQLVGERVILSVLQIRVQLLLMGGSASVAKSFLLLEV